MEDSTGKAVFTGDTLFISGMIGPKLIMFCFGMNEGHLLY